MSAELSLHPLGGYRFLPGIEPYSCGVVAEPGYEIVHATLSNPRPWHAGLLAVREYLEDAGRERQALCGVELRCPRPHSLNGFVEFNRDYRNLLDEWGIPVNRVNPVARTNVSPVVKPPRETELYGFSYTVPSKLPWSTFVIAGGGELRDGGLQRELIVRVGETSEDAMRDKATRVTEIMCERLQSLGDDHRLTAINVYTQHPVRDNLADVILPAIPAASRCGVHWFLTRPPVEEIEFEMDMRGVQQDIVVDL